MQIQVASLHPVTCHSAHILLKSQGDIVSFELPNGEQFTVKVQADGIEIDCNDCSDIEESEDAVFFIPSGLQPDAETGGSNA
jgi:hypothetical protein